MIRLSSYIIMELLLLAMPLTGQTLPDTLTSRVSATRLISATTLFSKYRVRPKGEFETSEAFRVRTELPSLRPLHIVLLDSSAFSVSYDADLENMDVSWTANDRLLLRSRTTTTGYYEAQNAYGARTTVARQIVDAFFVAIPGANYRIIPEVASIPIPHQRARAAKPNIRVAAYIRPTVDDSSGLVITAETSRNDPTVSLPFDIVQRHRVLHADIVRLVIFDRRDGRVLWSRTWTPVLDH